MDDKLAQRLRDAGFKGRWKPGLEELIDACGDITKDKPWGEEVGCFEFCLQFSEKNWMAGYKDPNYHEDWETLAEGKTRRIAVAELFIKLKKRSIYKT